MSRVMLIRSLKIAQILRLDLNSADNAPRFCAEGGRLKRESGCGDLEHQDPCGGESDARQPLACRQRLSPILGLA